MTAAPVEIVVADDKDALAQLVGARLRTAIEAARNDGRPAEVGLTGGSMGGAAVAALVRAVQEDPVDLSDLGLWWGDERYLPLGDPERNDTQADDAGLGSLGLPDDAVHRVPGPDCSADLEDAAQQYQRTIRDLSRGGFEVLLLGVGPDGHVASLFPGHPAQMTRDAITVAVHDSPKPPPERVSLTFEAMERAREVWFIVAGADKAPAVRDGVEGAPAEVSSAAQVRGTHRTVWFLDEPAASLLSR